MIGQLARTGPRAGRQGPDVVSPSPWQSEPWQSGRPRRVTPEQPARSGIAGWLVPWRRLPVTAVDPMWPVMPMVRAAPNKDGAERRRTAPGRHALKRRLSDVVYRQMV